MRRTRSGLCDESGVGLRRAFLFLLAVVLDVTTKAAARSLLAGAAVPLPFGARLSLHLNPGVAFGMAGAWGWLLGLGGIGILLFLTTMDPPAREPGGIGVALLWAGGLSNAVERVLLGGVTDFLYLPAPFTPFPGLFVNLADVWIGIGACLLMAALLFENREARKP